MMFWRVFMRISYTCPAQLKFGLTVEQWTALVRMTSESIDWLDANERVYDVWLLVALCSNVLRPCSGTILNKVSGKQS